MTPPSPPPVMKGGVRDILIDFSKKQSWNVEMFLALLLVLGIVFPSSISSSIIKQLATLPGRIVLFGGLVAILYYTHWVYGLLFALFVAILLSNRSIKEGFMSEYSFQIVDDSKKWFVEEILKENPIAIREHRVSTSAVQDCSEKSKSQDTKSTGY